jgi:hypothetical protein
MPFRGTLQLELQALHEVVAEQDIVAAARQIAELGSALVWDIVVVEGSSQVDMAVALVTPG